MENLKIQSTITSEKRPSFNDWCLEMKVSSGFFVVGQREVKLKQTVKPKKTTFIERIFQML
jgi:hypothetical protein